MILTDEQRVNLLSATNPRSGGHHPWEVNLGWGKISVLPNGQVTEVTFDINVKEQPLGLYEAIDDVLRYHARCKINHFNLGKSLIEKTLKQIEK